MNYGMSIHEIKRILLEENERFLSCIPVSITGYYGFLRTIAVEKITKLQTYEDIESYIHVSRNMSLTEWIESL
jgi:hypothetical protein